jgi:hypothetical protein
LSPAQRETIDVARITDEFRYKLVVALLLDGRKKLARETADLIGHPDLARQSRRLVAVCKWIPSSVLGGMLRRLWLWRQNRSFDWCPTPPSLQADFAAVQSRSGH